jgi:hypothetical protein
LFRYSKNYYTIFSINKVDKGITHIDSHRLTSTHTTSSQGNQGVRGVEKLKKLHFWGIFAPFFEKFNDFDDFWSKTQAHMPEPPISSE